MEKKVYRFDVLYGRSDLDRSFKTRNASCRYIAEIFALYGLKPISYKRYEIYVTDFLDLVDSILNFGLKAYE